MIALVSVALRRPYTFIVLAVLILMFGVLAAIRTSTDIFPNIGIPVISVVWTYNGLPPDDMSGRVVYYFERTVTELVSDVAHMESQSLAGFGTVNIYFQPSVDINAALAQVTASAQTVLKYLPAGTTPPYVLRFNASSVPILQIAVSSKTLPEQKLFDYAQNFIRPQLSSVAGAAIASPYGGKVRQVQIDIDMHALQRFGLSAEDVDNALASQNQITPVGTEKIGKFEYTVQLNDSPTVINDLNDVPVKKVNGTIVYMRDVSFVHDGYPPQTNIVRVNGGRAVLMTILKAGSASTLDVISGIKRLLPHVRETLPPDIQLDAVGDQSVFVLDAVSGVIREGAIAAALTGLMILIFLGSWRSTLIIMVSIPLAVLTSVTILSVLGETINVMTLGGLALAVGILVDDGTVTIENINYHLEQGKPIEAAIMDGARQIVMPAFVSLLCICIVFVPMFTLGGVAGYLFRPLAEAVVFALLGSFILSRTLVPTLAKYLLAAQAHHGAPHQPAERDAMPPPRRGFFGRFQHGFETRFERVRGTYRDTLALALARPWRFAGGFLVVVFLSFLLPPWLGQNFFPSTDSGQIKLHIRAQTGTRIEETARLCDQVENAVRRVIPPQEIQSVVDNIGLPISGVNIAYGNSGTIGVEDVDVLITLDANHGPTADYVRRLREALPRWFPGTTFSFLPADITTQILNFGLPAPIDIRITGQQLQKNRLYANQLLARISRVPGIADARIQQAFNEPTLYVDVDRTYAGVTGLTERDVTTSLQSTLAGSFQTAPTFWLDPRNGVSYPIVVQMPQYEMDSIGALANLPITARGSTQLVGALGRVRIGTSNAVVTHYDVQPAIDIYAAVQGRDLGSVAADINRILAQTRHDVPRGTLVALAGQVTTMTGAFDQLYFGLVFAIVLIYLLIVVNFQSWPDPFIIITALPAALAGIVWMLFATGTTLSVPALTGAVMCMGVATANSILIVSFAREQLAQGGDAVSAALEAGFTRFRPVLMTALAMIIGMGPMAFSADQNAPLGRAVIGGLIFATISTLFFVPTVFSLVHRRHRNETKEQNNEAIPDAPAPHPGHRPSNGQ
jgi:multidrug efflux pump subunit AcrB